MRERGHDGRGGPFDRVPDAPDNCVVCNAPLSDDNDAGEVPDYGDGGLTCSAACHAVWLVRDAEHRAAEQAADDARYQSWLESERDRG